MADEFNEAVEIIPGRFYVAFLRTPAADRLRSSSIAASNVAYTIDDTLLYEPFYADFGPLNMGRTYRFCETTKQLLQEADRLGKKLYLYTGPAQQQKANAAVLVGVFQVLYLNRSPDEAYALLARQAPFMPFRDASCGTPTFNLQPIDCIRGVAKARDAGFIDASGGNWKFDLAEYEHYEQVEHGDLNWIVPGKLVAFSGPAARPTDYVGFRAMVPEDYWEYFRRRGVQAVVRLNKKVYERKRFLDGGFQHHELYFPDGSCPSQDILLHFLAVAEGTPGALAIHCKAGLGRTGVLICSYIMKHYRFTAEEVIGYIRICRPGSVIGPQQNFIKEIQHIMWAEGDVYRAAHGPHPPPLMWGVTPMAAALASQAAAAAGNRAGSGCGAAAGVAGPGAVGAGPVCINLLVDATGQQVVVTSRGGQPARSPSQNEPHTSMPGQQQQLVGPVTPSLDKSISDLSLKQLQERLSHGMPLTHSSHGSSAGIARAPSSGSHASSGSFAASVARTAGITPQRLFNSTAHAGQNAAAAGGAFLSHRPATSSMMRSGAVGGALVGGATGIASNSNIGSTYSHHHGRSASANRERPATHSGSGSGGFGVAGGAMSSLLSIGQPSIASLRATLHTDTVAAAARQKAQPESGFISQSSDFIGSGWRTSLTSGATAGAVGAGSRPSSTVARVLAPNGQPRKMPMSAISGLNAPPPAAGTGAGTLGGKAKGPVTPQQQQQQGGRLSAYYS